MNSAPNRLGFFGPAGTFTHQAALLCANPDDDLLPFDPIDKVYDAVMNGHVDRAVAPIENSAEGYVPPSVAQLWRLRGKIFAVDHVSIPVTFSLYRKIGDHTQMTRLAGHPMALRQVSHWIEAKAVPTREASSSARGLEIAAKGEPGLYALGPPDVGEMFSLEEVEAHLEGKTANRTRFLALAAASAPLSGTRLCTLCLDPVSQSQMLMRAGLTLRNFQCTPIKTENSLGGYAYFCEWDLMAPINTDRASALDYGNDGWFIGVLGTIRG